MVVYDNGFYKIHLDFNDSFRLNFDTYNLDDEYSIEVRYGEKESLKSRCIL